MGFLDRFRSKRPKELTYSEMLSGGYPVFTQYGQGNYKDETIQACIYRIASEMKKLDPRHIRKTVEGFETVNDALNRVLASPNPRQTTSDFLEYITWQLYLNYNAFIVPYYDNSGNITMLYPLPQGSYSIMTDNDGIDYLVCQFNGARQDLTFVYKNVIHLRLKYSVNEIMGGNALGQPDNTELLRLGQLNSRLLSSVEKNVKGSIKGLFTADAHMGLQELKKSKDELIKLWEDDSGFAIIGAGSNYKELNNNGKNVDADVLEFVDSKILRYYGVSKAILSGDYTKAQYEAFYQSVLEPLVISWGQAFSKALFSARELQTGNEVKFFTAPLEFMTTAEKFELVRLLGDQGGMYLNEFRQMFGMAPEPELAGQRLQSLNYVQADKATQYQIGADDKINDKKGAENE